MAELSNPVTLLVCWFFGGIFALCGALCYGELGAKYPRAGGEYVFLRESFGKPMGFLSGWISLIVGFSAPIAASSIALSKYLFHAFDIASRPELVMRMFGIKIATLSMINLTAIAVIIMLSSGRWWSLPCTCF